MRIDVTGSGIEEIEPLKIYVTQRLRFVLSRFGERITRVGARLSRIQTEPEKAQLRCRLTVSLNSGRKILAEVSDRDAYAAIDQAVDRAQRFVGLRLVKLNGKVEHGRRHAPVAVRAGLPEVARYPRSRRKQGGGASIAVSGKGSRP
jgi:ribosomal subunit interface protein